MAKQGRKTRNRNESSETEASPMNTRSRSSIPAANDVALDQNLRSVANRARSESISVGMESFDNTHSPFFLHSADHPGLSIVTHTLDGSNYNNWSIAMRMSLDAKNKLSFVDGSLPRPDVDSSSFKIWSRCNSMVKAWILNVVNQQIYDSILYYEDAVEMWNDLYLRFRVSNLPRKYQLEQSITTLRQGTLDLATYYTKKKTLWEQLANTRSLTVKRCDCDHVKELMEEAETSRIIQFLMGLNDSFANIRGQILNMKPRPGLTEIYNMLDQDESQRLVGGSVPSTFTNHAAFQVQTTSTLEGQNQILLAHGSYQKPRCSYCHKLGHLADKCYKKHGYPPGYESKWKKPQTIGTANLAMQFSPSKEQSAVQVDQSKDDMSNDQIQAMISYLSTKLHSSTVESIHVPPSASTSNSVPVISQISASYKGYKLLDMETRAVTVSRHVIFHEDIFPFVTSNILDATKNFFPHLQSPADLDPFHAFLNAITNNILPQKYSDAKEFQVWCDAMRDEIGAMTRTNTWNICSLPSNKKAIGCKWVFTIKYNADGSIERYKARLVAKGYTQEEGLDYEETFSPVAKLASVRMLLLLAAKMRWSVSQLDISNAFLNGDLDEEIYMKIPPGYADLQGETLPPHAVCRLQKSIYGLKQASRQWFLKFKNTLRGLGFDKSHADHTLFTKLVNGVFLGVLVYVDDIMIVCNNDAAVEEFKEQLKSYFKLRDLGPAKYFLGIEIARSSTGISICQRKYILELLSTTGFLGSKPSSIPMDPSVKFFKTGGKAIPNPEVYRKLVGKLMYLQITRPDISYAVNTLCQFSSAPTDVHLNAVHKVLRYLKGTVGQGLFYPADEKFDLRGFSDSDWATCSDTRRSVTGYCMFIGDSLVSWKSKKQQTASSSTAEAEYRAMALATKELIWLSRLLVDLRVPFTPPAYLYCDNQAALHIANNAVFHERTKHVELDCHITRDQIELGFLKTMFVRTDNQLADPLTKALYPAPFREMIVKMGISNIFAPPS
ncbi:Retrotransposon Copia-like N-terminal [Arabidopsis suecica]|uniref:Retrotransposon Copia-like N-terminal n=1 Tax=Arabidopsis suecica TaxID=45249 RepID=A0A8T2BU87_ARASU|nr:Retrotransposon Copia-like N-terminal [Arabidopsis suecica]